MTENNTQTTHKQHIEDVFSKLSDLQWRFVTAMVENPAFTKKDAALLIGIKPDTSYRWDKYVDIATQKARDNVHEAALAMRKNAVLKAIAVKVKLLDSEDESTRSKAATEIIEWELGRAKQPTELTGKNGGAVEYKLVYPDD